MPAPSHKGIFVVLLVVFQSVRVAFIRDIISEEKRTWSAETFGPGQQQFF